MSRHHEMDTAVRSSDVCIFDKRHNPMMLHPSGLLDYCSEDASSIEQVTTWSRKKITNLVCVIKTDQNRNTFGIVIIVNHNSMMNYTSYIMYYHIPWGIELDLIIIWPQSVKNIQSGNCAFTPLPTKFCALINMPRALYPLSTISKFVYILQ